MKTSGSVAAMAPRPEAIRRDVTMPADVSKFEEKQSKTSGPKSGIPKPGKAAMQTHPGKAPLEITNAIRRRRETTDLDYWHTLPPAPPSSASVPPSAPSQAPRPLYRAVIRGPLHGDSTTTLCTLSSIVDAVNDNIANRKQGNHLTNGYHMTGNGCLIHTKNFSVVRADDMGLTISGLNIGEMKASKQQTASSIMTSPISSPRGQGWKGYSSNAKQRKTSPQNNNNSSNNVNNKSYPPNNTNETVSKNGKSNPKNGQSPKDNPKITQRSPRLYLTNRQNNLVEDFTDSKRVLLSPRPEGILKKDNNNNNNRSFDSPRSNTPKQNGLMRQTSLPLPSSDRTNANGLHNANSPRNLHNSNHTETHLAKRKFSNEVDNCKKLPVPNPSHPSSSSPSFSPSSSPSCVQLADSLISALTFDLDRMYSICHTKVRYAEFIERSQPHRLDDTMTNGQMRSSIEQESNSNEDSNNNNTYRLTTKENERNSNNNSMNNKDSANKNANLSKNNPKQTKAPSPLSPSSSSSSSSSYLTPKPNVSDNPTANKNSAPLRLTPITPKPNKYAVLGDPGIPDGYPKTVPLIMEWDRHSPRAKTTRPILKSSKTDIDTSLPSFRPAGDKVDSNNINSMGNNRLVRFKVNHEVREFAPSEPVRYY